MMPFHPVKPIRGGVPLDDFYSRLVEDPAWVCQAKLDGQRTLWVPSEEAEGGTLWSRRGLRIFKASEVVRSLAETRMILDGELIFAHGRANYFAFDLPDHKGPLIDRWAALEQWHDGLSVEAKQVVHLCPAHVDWQEVIPSRWEGVVFKKRSSPYVKAQQSDTTTPHWIKYRAEWM